MLTKSISALLFPVAWVAAALAARQSGRYRWRQLVRDVAVTTGVALIVSGWWLVRNQLQYGDLLAQKAFATAFLSGPSRRTLPSDFMHGPIAHLSLAEYVAMVVLWTLKSALGFFGPVHTKDFFFFPSWVSVFYGLIGAAGAVGFVRYLRRAPLAVWQRQAWSVCGLFGALLLASFVRFNFSFFQAQARYLFPALPAAAAAFCLGLEEVSPRRWRERSLAAAVAVLAFLAVLGLLYIVKKFLGA